MKVKATEIFNQYRNAALGLPKKDFRALQKGGVVDVDKIVIDKYPELFREVKKHGD